MLGTRSIVHEILGRQLSDLTSMVMCFKDAISLDDLSAAESNVLSHLDQMAGAVATGHLAIGDLPLIFLRVRNTAQFIDFPTRLTAAQAGVLPGFVFP